MQYGQLGPADRELHTLTLLCLQGLAPPLTLRLLLDRIFSLIVPQARHTHLSCSYCNLLLGIFFWRAYYPLDSLDSLIITLARFISGSATNE